MKSGVDELLPEVVAERVRMKDVNRGSVFYRGRQRSVCIREKLCKDIVGHTIVQDLQLVLCLANVVDPIRRVSDAEISLLARHQSRN